MKLYTNQQTFAPLKKRKSTYRQNSAGQTRWPDRLVHFDASLQHTAGNNLNFMEHVSGPPVKNKSSKRNLRRIICPYLLSD